jgi:hypothetical protein
MGVVFAPEQVGSGKTPLRQARHVTLTQQPFQPLAFSL